MAYTTLDPRKTIRSVIGTEWWDSENGDTYTINVEDHNYDTVRIPLRLSEETKTEVLDVMPYIEINLVQCKYTPHDIAASTRECRAYMDVTLYFTDTDNIDTTSFGKKVLDEIQNKIRTNQCTVFANTHNWHINVDDIRYRKELGAHQVVFQYVATVYVIYYETC